MSLKKLNKRLEKLGKIATIVKAMDDNRHYPDSFNAYLGDLLEFAQTQYDDITEESLRLFLEGETRQRLDFARQYLNNRRIQDKDYGLSKLEDIVNDLGDNLKQVAVSVIPIKDTDIGKYDNIDDLVKNYDETITTLEDNLENIDQERHPERYQAQQTTIQEYKEFKSVLEDYKDLVDNILGLRELTSYLEGERGRPNTAKMKELFVGYLDRLTEKYKEKDMDKDNIAILQAAKDLSNNPNYLTNYYVSGILEPAQEKYNKEVEKADLKDYVQRTVKVMNPNKQIEFFDVVHAASKEEEAGRIYRLYDLKKAA